MVSSRLNIIRRISHRLRQLFRLNVRLDARFESGASFDPNSAIPIRMRLPGSRNLHPLARFCRKNGVAELQKFNPSLPTNFQSHACWCILMCYWNHAVIRWGERWELQSTKSAILEGDQSLCL